MVMTGSILTLLPPLALLVAFRRPLLETFTVQQN
jgi:sn-glycerol 3-phosphate transport system permease protein